MNYEKKIANELTTIRKQLSVIALALMKIAGMESDYSAGLEDDDD